MLPVLLVNEPIYTNENIYVTGSYVTRITGRDPHRHRKIELFLKRADKSLELQPPGKISWFKHHVQGYKTCLSFPKKLSRLQLKV